MLVFKQLFTFFKACSSIIILNVAHNILVCLPKDPARNFGKNNLLHLAVLAEMRPKLKQPKNLESSHARVFVFQILENCLKYLHKNCLPLPHITIWHAYFKDLLINLAVLAGNKTKI
jgi:hypothetical protein